MTFRYIHRGGCDCHIRTGMGEVILETGGVRTTDKHLLAKSQI